MYRFSRSLFARCVLLPLGLTTWTGACYGWVPARPPSIELPAQAAKPASERDELRLRVVGGFAEGTLTDLTTDSVTVSDGNSLVSVPVLQVSSVDLRKVDTGKSILLGVGIAATAFGLVLGLAVLANELDGSGS